MRAQFERDQSADAVTGHDRIAADRVDRFGGHRGQVIEAKFAERTGRAFANRIAQIGNEYFPSDR